jgi:hypothetical protein
MGDQEPTAELEPQFSSEGAKAPPWSELREQLQRAKAYWLATVRPDGRPHVTTIAAIWLDGALHFTTGAGERKAKNLERNTKVVVTTGTDAFEGVDVVVEGEAVRVTDEARLRRLAAAYLPKYGRLFVFEVRDGALRIEGSEDPALAFEVRATKAFAFGKGESFSQTRYRF